MPLYIKVHPVVQEFIVSTRGNNVIEVGRQDGLFERIKFLLELPPLDYKQPTEKGNGIINLLIPFFNIGNKQINNLYRNHLNNRHQRMLSNEIKDIFKKIFHNYVLAYSRAGRQQKEGIYDFCLTYNITYNKINFEMLKKSWDRSEEKLLLPPELQVIKRRKKLND